jgi:hypothetical protein
MSKIEENKKSKGMTGKYLDLLTNVDFNNIESFCSIITQVIIVSKNINAYYSAI